MVLVCSLDRDVGWFVFVFVFVLVFVCLWCLCAPWTGMLAGWATHRVSELFGHGHWCQWLMSDLTDEACLPLPASGFNMQLRMQKVLVCFVFFHRTHKPSNIHCIYIMYLSDMSFGFTLTKRSYCPSFFKDSEVSVSSVYCD